MDRREFGSTGWNVSVIGQGSYRLDTMQSADALNVIRKGIDAGANHIDTAESYGDGQVDQMLGDSLEGYRDGVFLVSKVSPDHASRKGTVAAREGRLAASGPIGWIAICCTGRAIIRSRKRWRLFRA